MNGNEWKEAHDKQPERILCAAIWFDDGIVHDCCPKNIESGFVITGLRHGNCYATMKQLTNFKYLKFIKEEGFLTSKNRFVEREEAAKIAKTQGQIMCVTDNENELFSEDLY